MNNTLVELLIFFIKSKENIFLKYLNLLILNSSQGKLYLPLIEIKELNIAFTNISEDCIDNLASKLTTKIEKLNLQELKSITDRHINTLVSRCKEISVLDLKSTSITDDSLISIMENLQYTLEELNVGNTYVRNSAHIIGKGSLPKLISFNNWSFSWCCCCLLYSKLRNRLKFSVPRLNLQTRKWNFNWCSQHVGK